MPRPRRGGREADGNFKLGRILACEKKFKDALRRFQNAAPHFQNSTEFHYELARTYFELKNYEAARQEFQKIQLVLRQLRTKNYKVGVIK